jgi:hypothetical protein
MVGDAGMWPEGVVGRRDRKGKLYGHLAFSSIDSCLSTLLPLGIHPSAVNGGKGVLQTCTSLPSLHTP